MAAGKMSLVLGVLVAVISLAGSVQAQDMSNAYAFLSTSPDFSLFAEACKRVGLDKDHWFTNGRWEATIYAPTNAAMEHFLKIRKVNVKQWVQKNETEALYTLLQHMVSNYFVVSKNEVYDGQRQASLLTSITHRSRLTIGVDGKRITVSADLSKGRLSPPPYFRVGNPHTRITIIPITSVLVPDLERPFDPKPKYNTMWDVIQYHPGVEDFYAMALKAFTVNPKLKDILNDPKGVYTLMAANAQSITLLTKLLGRTATDIMADAQLANQIVQYHVVPGKAWTAKDLENEVFLPTLYGKHKLQMMFYHEHEVVASDYPEHDRGKMWNVYPRSLPIMKLDDGDYDLPCGKSMAHVIDNFLVPKA